MLLYFVQQLDQITLSQYRLVSTVFGQTWGLFASWSSLPSHAMCNVASLQNGSKIIAASFQMIANRFQGIDNIQKCITKWADMDATIFN